MGLYTVEKGFVGTAVIGFKNQNFQSCTCVDADIFFINRRQARTKTDNQSVDLTD